MAGGLPHQQAPAQQAHHRSVNVPSPGGRPPTPAAPAATGQGKSREYWIDAVRSFACLCVLCTHAPIPGGTHGVGAVAVFNYFAVAGASILFFMISGALVLNKPKPVFPFLRKRLTRIVFPMVFWTIANLLISVGFDGYSWSDFWRRVVMIPFVPQVGTYWFIYVVFGIYLLTPIMATWLERCSRRELEFYLLVWGAALLVPYLQRINPRFAAMTGLRAGYLFYFSGFLWLAVMGHYLRRYVTITRYRWWHYAVFICLLAAPALLYATPMPHSMIQDRMSLNIVALCVCYFVILKHLPLGRRTQSWCYDFAQHSFGIYLVHILVMRRVLWPLVEWLDLNYVIQIPLVVVLTAALSYLLVHLIGKLPGSKYIVGL